MNIKKTPFLLLLFLGVHNSFATSPCEIKDNLKKISKLSRVDFASFKNKIELECDIQKKYKKLKKRARKIDSSIDLDYISEARALRFIGQRTYEKVANSKTKNRIPVSYIYQPSSKNKEDTAPKSTIVWDSWEDGVSFVSDYSQMMLNNENFLTLDLLAQSQRRFYMRSFDIDSSYNPVRPDQMRDRSGRNNIKQSVWWPFSSKAEENNVIKTFNEMNALYKKMGLLPKTGLVDQKGRTLDVVIRADEKGVYAVAPDVSIAHTKKWISFFNEYSQIIKSNYLQGVPSNYPLLTPLEFAAFMQKWIVTIHPFANGNGRSSKLWADVVSKAFKLPFTPTGAISRDIDISHEAYYQSFLKVTQNLVFKVMNTCIEIYDNKDKWVRKNEGLNISAQLYKCTQLEKRK